jgi:CheY-like chemotaxis protein
MLEGTGHRVALAANGSEGIEALDDATMPELDGSGFLARLAQRADLNDFTVVVMSADPAKVNEMSHLPRVVEFLLKPINLDDLLVLVGRHCS